MAEEESEPLNLQNEETSVSQLQDKTNTNQSLKNTKNVDCDENEEETAQYQRNNAKEENRNIENNYKVIPCVDSSPESNVCNIGSSYSDDEVIQGSSEDHIKTDDLYVKRVIYPDANVAGRRKGYRMRSRSLCNFELNEYTLGEIRRLHERLASRQPASFRGQSKSFKNFSRTQILALWSLCIVDFTSFCSMSIMAPFFPIEASLKGMSESTSGFVFGFYALVIFVTSPIIGRILPSVGGKFIFMSGLFVAGSCHFLFGLLEYIKEEWLFTLFCFLVRGLEALGASAYSTATYVFVVEIFPGNVGAVIGILETFVGLGMSTGPAIGGFLYSIGGFGLPFYSLGVIMVAIVPINLCLLPSIQGNNVGRKPGSVLELMKIPSVIVIGLVVIITSNVWGFLDPTLEPHLRQFQLTPGKVGLIFLLFSGLYGISSPLWGFISDKSNCHFLMITLGLLLSTLGLLLLGPTPFISDLPNTLWLNLVALSILGVSVALSLLPTFQSLLDAAVDGGCRDELSTYSLVAGAWSCLYALGEVIGPLAGGVLTENYGFPICCTVMACATFTLAVIISFFCLIQSDCSGDESENWNSYESACYTTSSEDVRQETRPLLTSSKSHEPRGYRSLDSNW